MEKATGETQFKDYLLQKISIAIQRENYKKIGWMIFIFIVILKRSLWAARINRKFFYLNFKSLADQQ